MRTAKEARDHKFYLELQDKNELFYIRTLEALDKDIFTHSTMRQTSFITNFGRPDCPYKDRVINKLINLGYKVSDSEEHPDYLIVSWEEIE